MVANDWVERQSNEWTRDGRVPFTRDELTVTVEGLREYRMRLGMADARRTVVDMLIYRLGARLAEMETQS